MGAVMSMNYLDRNTIPGFAMRVRKNYEFVASARAHGADVHIVTQLQVSLLGLLVFPYEYLRRDGRLPGRSESMEVLEGEGWPSWNFAIGNSATFDEHLRHLRNALSHRRFEFSSDSRELEQVHVRLWDQREPDSKPYWMVSIKAVDLRDFVFRFADLIDRELPDFRSS
jgi:hypothetical protein